MRFVYSPYMNMDGTSDNDTIKVADRSERPRPSAPASSTANTMNSNNLAAQISESIKEFVRSDTEVSDFDLSPPPQQNTAIGSPGMESSVNSLLSTEDNAEPCAKDGSPPTSLNEAEEGGSEASSPLSTLSRTPTPPPELESAPAPQTSSTKRTTYPEIKHESPSPPTPKRLSQPPQLLSGQPDSQAPKPSSRLRRTDHEVECTHRDVCSCRIHAAHPSVRDGSRGVGEAYPHFSEWALGMMEWPESGARSSIEREGDWRAGRAWR